MSVATASWCPITEGASSTRHPDRTLSRRRFLLHGPPDPLWRSGGRITRRQEGNRDLCQRDRPGHGPDRLSEPRSAGSRFSVARRLGAERLSVRDSLRVAPNNVWFQLHAAKDCDITDAV